jgi:hypothetical protein
VHGIRVPNERLLLLSQRTQQGLLVRCVDVDVGVAVAIVVAVTVDVTATAMAVGCGRLVEWDGVQRGISRERQRGQ